VTSSTSVNHLGLQQVLAHIFCLLSLVITDHRERLDVLQFDTHTQLLTHYEQHSMAAMATMAWHGMARHGTARHVTCRQTTRSHSTQTAELTSCHHHNTCTG